MIIYVFLALMHLDAAATVANLSPPAPLAVIPSCANFPLTPSYPLQLNIYPQKYNTILYIIININGNININKRK